MNKEKLLSKIEMHINTIKTVIKFKDKNLLGCEFDSYNEFKKEVEKKYNEVEEDIKTKNIFLKKFNELEIKTSDLINRLNIRSNYLLTKIDCSNNKNKIYFDLLRLRTFINNFFKKYLGLKFDILKIDALKLEEKINSYFNKDDYKKELQKIREKLDALKIMQNQILKLKSEIINKIQLSNQYLVFIESSHNEISELYKKEDKYLFVKENFNIIISKLQPDKVLNFYDFIYIELDNNIDLIYKIIKVLQMLPKYKRVLSFIENESEKQIIIDFIIEYTIYGDEFNKIVKKRKKLKCF